MEMEIRSVENRDGVTLQYVEHGLESGLPVLFLHGLSDSWHSFERVVPLLPESIRAFALTQRGHGDADRPDTGYDPQTMASDVADVMDALKLESAVIVGHSLASVVAQRFAILYPARTKGLVLVSSFASFPKNPVARELWESTISQMQDPVDPEFVREFQASTISRPVPDRFFETIVQESLKVPARVWRSTVEGYLSAGSSSELSKIEAPTLIIWGDQDGICSRQDQEVQAAAIPSSRLVVYEGLGHAPHWEDPERFKSYLEAFAEAIAG